MLAAAPDGPLRGVPVVIKDEWPLPWRAQRFGAAELMTPTAPGRVRPLPRPARRRRDDRRGRQHARARRRQHRQRLLLRRRATTPGHRALPRRLLERPGRLGRRRLVAGAVGADGVGSVRFPAAYCGLTGLKPTFGRSAMEGHHMAPVTTLIVSGPLCADAADCRLLGSVLFGEELAAGDAAGLRIGVVRDAVSEDVTPEVREACEAAIEALRAETGGEVAEISLPDLERRRCRDPDHQRREHERHDAGAAQPPRPRAQPDRPRHAQVPDAAAGGGDRAGGPGADADAAPPRGAVRRGRRARLADRPGAGAAAGGAAGRAALRHADRRPGQRARRRARQPDRHPGDQRAGRAQRRGPAARACSCRRPGAATSCCSTPPRRWSAPTAAAGSSRGRRSPRPSRRRSKCRRRSSSRGSSAPSTRCSRSRASTSRSARARSTASSAPTAPARRRRCGC